jgi:zinc/manganese transport system ATP-binding protein
LVLDRVCVDGGHVVMQVVLEHMSLGYGRRTIVSGINGTLGAGETIALTGCNGSGKSTLLRAIAGRLKPISGTVNCKGLLVADIGYLPQSANLNRDVPVRVADYCASGLFARLGASKGVDTSGHQRVRDALERVGLTDASRALIHEISGGQFQRLAFARIMVQDPQLILLDEPFAALDATISESLMSVIAEWSDQGRCVVAALHHGAMIPRFSRQLNLDHGSPTWVGEDSAHTGSETKAGAKLRLVSGDGAA